MRNSKEIAKAEREFNYARHNAAWQDGPKEVDFAYALHCHQVLTALHINAEWERQEDMKCTINQLEAHCESLEISNIQCAVGILIALVCGAVWGNDVLMNIIWWLI